MRYLEFSTFCRKVANIITERPAKVFADDVFIASYPKSGNTWIRFIFSHLLTQYQRRLSFVDSHKIISVFEINGDTLKSWQWPGELKTEFYYKTSLDDKDFLEMKNLVDYDLYNRAYSKFQEQKKDYNLYLKVSQRLLFLENFKYKVMNKTKSFLK